jgi:Fungal chitosanase of glycosyl hydrolase group 75
MKWTFFYLCFVGYAMAQPSSVPAWVIGEPEAVSLQKPRPVGYLAVTQTATVLRPKALTKLGELEQLNPGLTKVLPALSELLPKASIASNFRVLYDAKIKSVATGNLMETHSFFDCATVLNLTAATTGRKAILFQSDMETDTDGTDPVRMSRLEDYADARLSRSFQPVLAYSWAQTQAQSGRNPFIDYYSQTLTKLRTLRQQVDTTAKTDPAPMWTELSSAFTDHISKIDRYAKYYAEDLRSRRSLIASQDPFIVVPQTWVSQSMQVGNYAAVIHAGKIYPCIIGDTGPTTKAGEASQRLARAIDPEASGRRSAVMTAAVTYIVFPHTGVRSGTPDLAAYKREVTRLLGELGGLGAGIGVHAWTSSSPAK